MRALHPMMLVVAGCYSPTAAVGIPCGPGGECPSGQTCNSTGTCGVDGNGDRDAAVDDAQGSDTSTDAAILFTPSNGVSISALTGVDQAIPGNGNLVFHTDTGEITRDGTTIRAAGTGIISGVGFEQAPTLGVFAATGLNLMTANTMSARGMRALVLLVEGDIKIQGTISVSAGTCPGGQMFNVCAGPGGGTGAFVSTAATGCGPGGEGASAGDTGGGGGGFGQTGGAGGAETDDGMSPGGLGGSITACSPESLEPLAGGGGGGTSGGSGGAGGGGGGAIQITALRSIEVSGTIIAGGRGGFGGGGTAGGGGGGAGGAILLEAPTVDVIGATIAANGGGGGEGATNVAGAPGAASASPAQGGDTTGRAGGDGGCLGTQPTAGSMAINDTGGGGGGAGRVRINATVVDTATAVISPAPSLAQLKP